MTGVEQYNYYEINASVGMDGLVIAKKWRLKKLINLPGGEYKMTDEEFDDFLDDCYQELEDKQALLFKDYHLGSYDKYWFDQASGTIQFKNAERIELEFVVVPIGSWSSKSNTWMWAWANKYFIEELKKQSIRFKGLVDFTGFDIFGKEVFRADESMAYELTSMAIHFVSAMGMYIVPSNNLKTFFALVEIKQ